MKRIALLLLLALAIPARAEEPFTPAPSTADAFRQFAGILDVLQKHYVDPSQLKFNERAALAFREFVRSLDEEAELLTPEEFLAAKNPPQLPISLAARDGRVVIVAARAGTAAQKAGVLYGDELLCEGRRQVAAQEWLRTSSVLVVRERASNRGTTVSNDTAVAGSLRLIPLAPGVVYCRLPEISSPLASELRELLLKQRLRAVILDLRNNPGGSLDAALQCARLFLPDQARIVALDYAQPEQRIGFVSDSSPKFRETVVLLVNGGTAAEAEILAAALRDNNRAQLVGSRTFGRGWHYELFPLPDGSALRIPTTRYLPPSKTSFQRTGLTPDEVVEVPRETERELTRTGFGAVKTDRTLARALELIP